MSVLFRTVLDHIDQMSSPDHINPGGNSVGLSHHRLLFKFFHAHRIIHLQCSKPARILSWSKFFTHDRNVCAFCYMIFQNLVIVHLIHRIAGCNDNVRFVASLQKIKILVNRICGSSVPVSVICCDCRGKYIKSALFSSEIPPLGGIQMFIQRTGIILC